MPNHLIWLISVQRSSGSTPSSPRMAELLTSKGQRSHNTHASWPAGTRLPLQSPTGQIGLFGLLKCPPPHLGHGWSSPGGGPWNTFWPETLPGVLNGILPHHRSQLTTRWWSVDSSAPLFIWVSRILARTGLATQQRSKGPFFLTTLPTGLTVAANMSMSPRRTRESPEEALSSAPCKDFKKGGSVELVFGP